MPDEQKPVFTPPMRPPGRGNWITRNKKLLSAVAVGGLLLLFLLADRQGTKPPMRKDANAHTSTQTGPSSAAADQNARVIDNNSEHADYRVHDVNRDGRYSEGAAAAPPQKSKAQEAQEQLEYASLYGDNVVLAPADVKKTDNSTPPETDGQKAQQSPLPAEPERARESLGLDGNDQQQPKVSIRKKLDFDPSRKTYTLPQGTVIETVLTGKLEGAMTGPVDCMVTTDVYYPGTRLVLIPQGASVLGEAEAVRAFGEERLAVVFHRIIVFNGDPDDTYSIPIEMKLPALDQQGGVGLTGKVDNHFLSTFAAAGAVGLVGGLSQIGNGGYGGANGYDASQEFRNGISQSMAQSSMRVLDRFLNRMPKITVPPGTRVKIKLTDDLSAPAAKETTDGV